MTQMWTRKPRLAKKFPTRKSAAAAAEAIGYPASAVTDHYIMGFRQWSICDPHMRLLTQEGFEARMADIAAS